MDKIAECRNRIVDLCCPDGAKEFVRGAVASILYRLVEEKFTSANSAMDAIALCKVESVLKEDGFLDNDQLGKVMEKMRL